MRNFPQITEGQGDVVGEFSQSQSKIFFQCFLEKNYIPGKGINIIESQITKINQWPLFTFLFENEVCGVNDKSANYFDVVIYGVDFKNMT